MEHYFIVNTDGTDEQALYDAEGCGCAHWSADGTHVLTLQATEHGTYSFTTYRPDGSDRVVLDNPIDTLNLAPGATTADGRWIAFNGWDETDPSNTGLYLASPDLSDLRLALPLPEDMLAVEPFGITPDAPPSAEPPPRRSPSSTAKPTRRWMRSATRSAPSTGLARSSTPPNWRPTP